MSNIQMQAQTFPAVATDFPRIHMAELMDYNEIAHAAWSMLHRAANDPEDHMRLVAIATVTSDGKPSNRLLVLRGADCQRACVWFHTDRRSPKVRHLEARPYVSALMYAQPESVQIRLDGPVTLHRNDTTARQHWEQTSLAVRYAYGLPAAPGEALRPPDPRMQSLLAQRDQGRLTDGWENFLVIEMNVEILDWLQVNQMGQRRATLRADNGWKPQPMTP